MPYHAGVAQLTALQNSAFSMWVLGSDSIWSFPTILTLHTIGLAVLVGAAIVIDLRVIGVGRAVPLETIGRLYRFVWAGFVVNLASGIVLFVVRAADHAVQPMFYLKLAFVAAGVGFSVAIERRAFRAPLIPPSARLMAALSLVCWLGAITAGRLMAYFEA